MIVRNLLSAVSEYEKSEVIEVSLSTLAICTDTSDLEMCFQKG
jgi:hypothetical protein